MDSRLIPIVGFVVFLVFVGLMITVSSYLRSVTGGWAKLAKIYRRTGSVEGEEWQRRVIRMRAGTKYGAVVNIGVGNEGLHLSVPPLSRVGHPSLFVPWSEVSATEKGSGPLYRVELRFGQTPDIPVQIRAGLAGEQDECLRAIRSRLGIETRQ